MGPPPQKPQTFHWSELHERALDLDMRFDMRVDADERRFVSDDVTLVPPRVVPWPFRGGADSAPAGETVRERAARVLERGDASLETLASYADAIPSFLPKQCLILLQAGAASIAYFDKGEAVSTKSMKRYVKRGKGRAQATYLNAKGKSRYGSRLRLQNARALHDDVNERLNALWKEHGSPAQIFVSAPKRIWADQFEGSVQPPFERETQVERIPIDLPVPTTDVLLRAYKSLCYGQLYWAEGAAEDLAQG